MEKLKWKNRKLPRGVYVDPRGYVMVRMFNGGKRLPKKSFGKASPLTIDEAIRYSQRLKENLKLGAVTIDSQKAIRWPFPYAWEQIKEHLPPSRHCYGTALKSFFSKYYFDELWFKIVEGYRPFRRAQMVTQGTNTVSDSTINLELGVLSSMYYTLKELKLLGKAPNVVLAPQSPTFGLKNRHVDEFHLRRKRIITPNEFQIIMSEASPRMQRKILAALNTGLRRKDIFSLKRDSWAQYMDQLEGLAHKVGTSYKSPANRVVEQLFETSEGGNLVDKTNHRGEFDQLRRICREKHNIPDFLFKDFRRTAAWNIWLKEKNIILCQEFLNHKSIEMTKRYLGITLEDLSAAGKILEKVFSWPPRTVRKTVPNEISNSINNNNKAIDS